MKKGFKLQANLPRLRKWLGFAVVVALIVLEIVICAQSASNFKEMWVYGMLIFCCILLDVSVTLKYYVIKSPGVRSAMYGADFFCLLVISMVTGNDFCVVLYCLVTTEFYINNESLKLNLIVFGISAAVFVASFVLGWVRVYEGANLYDSIVQILGGCLFGIIILAIHFVIVLALMRFYRMSKRLSEALAEADASKARLKEAYEMLSRTAVFEERNRIAKDIHDNAGHSITTVIMQTEAAKLLIDSDPDEAKNKIISANIQAKNALDQMRTSVHLLAGRAAESSLKDGIEEIVAQTVDSSDMKIRTDVEDITLDEERARFLFNSVKECISNGMRHGGATAFYIEAKRRRDGVYMLVSDNGSGPHGEIVEGYGLKSMRERAEKFGGTMHISGEPQEGCEVEIFIKERA